MVAMFPHPCDMPWRFGSAGHVPSLGGASLAGARGQHGPSIPVAKLGFKPARFQADFPLLLRKAGFQRRL